MKKLNKQLASHIVSFGFTLYFTYISFVGVSFVVNNFFLKPYEIYHTSSIQIQNSLVKGKEIINKLKGFFGGEKQNTLQQVKIKNDNYELNVFLIKSLPYGVSLLLFIIFYSIIFIKIDKFLSLFFSQKD